MITIIDYGMGNIGSLENMIKRAGGTSQITSDPDRINQADKLILPGVGAFDPAITKLRELRLVDLLRRKVVENKTPILCICLGAQLITRASEEGSLRGLGWIDAETVRFRFPPESRQKIPHMGWNDVRLKKDSVLFQGMPENPCFYFVHSYHLLCHQRDDILTATHYGYDFVSAVQHDNIYATQFHPEKSHKYGLKLIENYLGLQEC